MTKFRQKQRLEITKIKVEMVKNNFASLVDFELII